MSTKTNTKYNMKEIKNITGLVVEYSPDQLKFKNYELPKFIIDENGNEMMEAEELLAWIIDQSRREKKWVAVRQQMINDDVQQAYFDYQAKQKLVNANKRRMSIFRRIKFFYYLKLILSFGFLKEDSPVLKLHANIPMQDVGKVSLFEEPIDKFHKAFRDSYNYLRNNGYLLAKTENYILYLYPSKKVIEDVRKFTLPASFYKSWPQRI